MRKCRYCSTLPIPKATISQTTTSPLLKIQAQLQLKPTPPREQNPSSPDKHICYTYLHSKLKPLACILTDSAVERSRQANACARGTGKFRYLPWQLLCIYLKGARDSAAKRASIALLRVGNLVSPPKEFAERVNRASAAAVFRLCHRCVAVRQRRRRNAPRAPLEMPVW